MKDIELIKIVTRTVKRHQMLPLDAPGKPDFVECAAGVPVVLMVSGGSDSVALARLLPMIYRELDFTILHINHMLRGKAADGDESFVADLARELGLPCEVRRFDVAALAAACGGNIEQVARELRYAEANKLLDELCARADTELSCGRIMTAHTLDDRVETFFMRSIVGAGAGALSSVPFVNGRVVRPLMDLSREQLRGWLLSLKNREVGRQLWREDTTNEDTSKLRAFVRHELIPLAKTRNPDLLATVAHTLNNLSLDDQLLSSIGDELVGKLCSVDENGITVIDGALFGEHEALTRRVIYQACKRVLPSEERITSFHVDKIARDGGKHGFSIDLPGGVRVQNEYGRLRFYPAGWIAPAAAEETWHAELDPGDSCLLPDGRTLTYVSVAPSLFADDPLAYVRDNSTATQVFIDADKLLNWREAIYVVDPIGQEGISDAATLYLSHVQVGDKYCPLGMGGKHKLVSDVLIDNKIPAAQRASLIKVSAQSPASGLPRQLMSAQGAESSVVREHRALSPSSGSNASQEHRALSPSSGSNASQEHRALSQNHDSQGKSDTLQAIVWLVDIQLDERFKVSAKTRSMFSILVT